MAIQKAKRQPRTSAFRHASNDDIAAVASLCKRALREPLDEEEVQAALHDEYQDVWIAGDPKQGIVAITRSIDGSSAGFVRLLAVDPTVRRRGVASQLLTLAERELSDVDVISIGTDAPHYLFPGVDTRDFDLMCFLEKHRYRRKEANVNLRLRLDAVLHLAIDGVSQATAEQKDAVLVFAETHWPQFRDELPRALQNETLFIAQDEDGIAGFCAHSVGRRGWIGPAAVRPDLLGKGLGRSLVAAAARHIHELGWHDRMQIEWVGPLRPYAALGATLESTFFVYRKERAVVHPIDERRREAQGPELAG